MKVSSSKEDANGKMKGAPPLSGNLFYVPPQPSQVLPMIPAPGRLLDFICSVETVKPRLVSKSKWRRMKRLTFIKGLPSVMPPVDEYPVSVVDFESVGNESESGCTAVQGNM